MSKKVQHTNETKNEGVEVMLSSAQLEVLENLSEMIGKIDDEIIIDYLNLKWI